ncbi:hypothetical protein C8R44DRAFT_852967 [Mycena epipterygia]|nr:hypothetical protein C8R44DRAFT_852967 [Mycena epipterygia]
MIACSSHVTVPGGGNMQALWRCGGGTLTRTVSETERTLPPLQRVISDPNWVDDMVAARQPSFKMAASEDHAHSIFRSIAAYDRRAPYANTREVVEKETDDYHLHTILIPAVVIAAAMRDESLVTGYPRARQGTASGLSIHTESAKATTHWVMVDDKRAPVFAAHEEQFRTYSKSEKFPWPNKNEMEKAEAGMRLWIQLWGQMYQYEVNFVKLFSPAGVVYVRRDNLQSKTLSLSKTYRDLDGDVERTVCIILAAREQAQHLSTLALCAVVRCQDWISPWMFSFLLWISWYRQIRGVYILFSQHDVFFRDVSEQFDFSSTISAHSFTKWLGRGASGMVVSSASGSEVVKLFSDEDLARHEVDVLQRARGLAVPDPRGVISDGEQTGVVMSYGGSPIRDFERATTEQKGASTIMTFVKTTSWWTRGGTSHSLTSTARS